MRAAARDRSDAGTIGATILSLLSATSACNTAMKGKPGLVCGFGLTNTSCCIEIQSSKHLSELGGRISMLFHVFFDRLEVLCDLCAQLLEVTFFERLGERCLGSARCID